MTLDKSEMASRRFYSRFILLTLSAAISFFPYCSKAETKPVYPTHIDYLPGGGFNIQFAPGSSSVPDEAKEAMIDRMPCIKAINLQILVVVVYPEIAVSQDGEAQASLAATRASTVRTFFEDMGVPSNKIYTENRTPRLSDSFSIPSGVAAVEYFGTCARTFAECQKVCSK
jgi:hypothetical protein